MAKEITDQLKGGMQLKITNNPAFTKRVQDYYKKEGKKPPDYIRWIELTDKTGKSLGSFGVGLSIVKKSTSEIDV